MGNPLIYKKYKKGFSLLEVVISLLIVSITFIAYSQLIEQNLKAQIVKKDFVQENRLKVNILTVYVSDPNTDEDQLQEFFNVKNIEENRVSKYRNYSEINVTYTYLENPDSITIIK
tara:strand:- start:490 stop:837 length:348 start_codon:yes stop_codon:yes gene_type:complete